MLSAYANVVPWSGKQIPGRSRELSPSPPPRGDVSAWRKRPCISFLRREPFIFSDNRKSVLSRRGIERKPFCLSFHVNRELVNIRQSRLREWRSFLSVTGLFRVGERQDPTPSGARDSRHLHDWLLHPTKYANLGGFPGDAADANEAGDSPTENKLFPEKLSFGRATPTSYEFLHMQQESNLDRTVAAASEVFRDCGTSYPGRFSLRFIALDVSFLPSLPLDGLCSVVTLPKIPAETASRLLGFFPCSLLIAPVTCDGNVIKKTFFRGLFEVDSSVRYFSRGFCDSVTLHLCRERRHVRYDFLASQGFSFRGEMVMIIIFARIRGSSGRTVRSRKKAPISRLLADNIQFSSVL